MDSTISAHALFRGLEDVGSAPNVPVSAVIAWGVRAPDNIGAIVRLAANFACDRVFFVEERGTAHNQRRIRKAAVSAPSHVDWCFLTPAEFAAQHSATQSIVGLETSRESVDLRKTQWPQGCALMVGGERLGLPDEALRLCRCTVHIPACGPLRSLNVSHALAIALFGAACQQTTPYHADSPVALDPPMR